MLRLYRVNCYIVGNCRRKQTYPELRTSISCEVVGLNSVFVKKDAAVFYQSHTYRILYTECASNILRFGNVADSQCHTVGHCPLSAAYSTATDAILAIGCVPFPAFRIIIEFTWVSTQGTINKIYDSLS
jgi:hypothetical protein